LKKHEQIQKGLTIEEEVEKDDAALVIKKYWRGYRGRKTVE